MAWVNVAGLVINLLGVMLLFRYGMPFRVTASQGEFITTQHARAEEVRLDRRYRILGNLGLAAIVLGTALQACASLGA